MQINKFWICQFLGHMTLKVTWPKKINLPLSQKLFRDRAKQTGLSTLEGLIHKKIEIFDFRLHDLQGPIWPQKYKFAVNWEIVRDRAKQSEFWIFWFLGHMTLKKVSTVKNMKVLVSYKIKLNKMVVILESKPAAPLVFKRQFPAFWRRCIQHVTTVFLKIIFPLFFNKRR